MRQIASKHFDDVGRTRDMNPKISRVQFVHGCSIFLVCWIPGSFVEKKKFWSTTGVRSTNVATSTNTTPVITSINHCDPNGIRTRVTTASFLTNEFTYETGHVETLLDIGARYAL